MRRKAEYENEKLQRDLLELERLKRVEREGQDAKDEVRLLKDEKLALRDEVRRIEE